MNLSAKILLAVLPLALATGCVDTDSETVVIEVVFNSDQCNLNTPQNRIFADANSLREFRESLSSSNKQASLPTVLGQNNISPFAAAIKNLATSHDFSNSTLVLFARGPQPNPGYGIDVTSAHAALTNGKLTLPLELLSPDPDAMYAQVIMSPCVVVAVKTAKAFDTVTLYSNE